MSFVYLREFPDFSWLKQQAESGFQDRSTLSGQLLEKPLWPVAIVHVKEKNFCRSDIKGPFSLFSNLKGSSLVRINGRTVKLGDDFIYLSNRSQYYTLEGEHQEVETFNLHLGQDLWEDFLRTRLQKEEQLLENPTALDAILPLADFPNQLIPKDKRLSERLRFLQEQMKHSAISYTEVRENLVPLFETLLILRGDLMRLVAKVPATRLATKKEIYKRIAHSVDFILSHPFESINLDELSRMACLSKFHYLRAFQEIHGLSPHRFVVRNRVQKSAEMIRRSSLPISDISAMCGFSDLSDFSRTFKRWMTLSPEKFRQVVK